MTSIKERLAALRERRPFIDHLVRMQQHYGAVKGNQQAGAVTYFGFLSFFPILALAFAGVGLIAGIYPDARDTTLEAISEIFPGLIGGKDGVQLADIEDAAGAAIGIGVLGVLYAGLGWLSSMRDGLLVVFEQPSFEQPNFVFGKLRDLLTLTTIGFTLFLSVAVSSVVAAASGFLLDLVGLGEELSPLLRLLSVAIGLLASMVLFLALFRLLADPETPKRSLVHGALFGAIGFEVLKQLSGVLLASTKNQPAFQAFGIALILVVWINYFSRVVMYAAAWAHTSPAARALRVEGAASVQGPPSPSLVDREEFVSLTGDPAAPAKAWVAPFAAGGAAMLGLVALVRKKGAS